MHNDSRLSSKIKARITRFAGRLSEGLSKPRKRFVREMLYGIQAAKDVKVSNIARTLNESIRLIKTENRLCRELASEDLTERVNGRLCWEGSGRVSDTTVLAVDLGDISKPHARKMEHLARVRDGSTGQLSDGYWLCEVVAADVEGDSVTPLYGELYSHVAEDFKSENAQILKAIDAVSRATEKRGIFVIDRGGDRRNILIPLIDRTLRFVVRQKGDRHIIMGSGKKRSVAEAARWCQTTTKPTVEVEREGYRVKRELRLGSLQVRFPDRPEEPMWLVVIRGFSETPILLLTNVAPMTERAYPTWIAELYLTRWKCEEAYRFIKQSYQLEDIRVRRYVALRNLYVLVHATFYFVSIVIGAKAKMSLIFKRICEKSKRFYEVASFFQYAIADGIHRLLFGSRSGVSPPARTPDTAQLKFDFAKPPS